MSVETLTIREDAERHRFVGLVGEEVVSVADFREVGDVVLMPHTETAYAHRGNGYAKQVVVHALDEFRRRGRRVVPQCAFVAEVIAEEPQYADLVASDPS